ncbi:YdeI/OmpD-associated family protein [Flavobacterium sp. PL02]|uniref:YdeI/OmpD-associated family protein n=1 Tax=Flavobacterium sp. PL02 TaxID=3088354 RepID=UPI00057D6152|nr:YdeI/OmpD-associated family protein [Flavobacterium sp. PL02]KIC01037.1 bacteriocin-protection protein [Flavobacterium sp. JRM]MEA9415414.1 YdeI/OmpD-associated family protein [Flavobacterium sp. PL02]
MNPMFFEDQSEFRKWLTQNHLFETELLVGFYKVNSNKPSMTWSQSVDEALCFGWIDGVRRSVDADSYSIRFTPRKATSIWSAINIKKVEDLTEQGLMQPAGIASFKLRKEDKSRIYTHEIEEVHFSDEFEEIFKTNEKAWNFFQALAPSYKKVSKNWVMSAKQETTRIKRLNELIADSAESKNKWKY